MKRKSQPEPKAGPAPAPPVDPAAARKLKDQDYFKVYAPKALRRELHIEAMDVDKSTARYTREIIEERLPHELRMVLRRQAEAEGTDVPTIVMKALADAGVSEAASLLGIETKPKKRR